MVKMMKSKSKRMPASKRYKIERKVREHNRKLRRQTAKEKKGRKKNMKLIVVPGDCPFRSKILAEANELRGNIEAEKVARKEAGKEARKQRKTTEVVKTPSSTDVQMEETPTSSNRTEAANFQEMVQKAEARGYIFEQKRSRRGKAQQDDKVANSTRAFYKEFQHVVQESDVVIEVLDARDPLGTRSEEVEETIRNSSDKRLILILNKSDLIPVENMQKWVRYLRATCGTVVLPFKANTQKQKNKLGSAGKAIATEGAWNTSKSVGVADLLSVLGNWSKNSPGGITVGVVGMPNVGKSSIINSLKRSRACTVGAKEGVTRSCQKVNIDSQLKIIDSPGVYLSDDKTVTVTRILERVPKETLILHYCIPDFASQDEFLAQIAMKYNLLKKGGLANTENAEQKVVSDWQSGQIKFFTEPPELDELPSASIVSELAQPFDIEAMSTPTASVEADDDSMDDNDSDEDVTPSQGKKVRFQVELGTGKSNSEGKGTPGKQVGLTVTRKTIAKKMRKSKKKSTKKADELSKVVEGLSFD